MSVLATAEDASGASTKPNSAKAASSREMINFVRTPTCIT